MKQRLSQIKLFLAFLIGVVIVLYFSWLPNPNIGSASYFPKWLGNWTNHFGNLRTAVPFFLLAAILESGLTSINNFQKKRWLIILSLAVIVTVAEIGQLFLAHRHFDVMDIFWGITGSVAGMFMAWTCKWLLS